VTCALNLSSNALLVNIQILYILCIIKGIYLTPVLYLLYVKMIISAMCREKKKDIVIINIVLGRENYLINNNRKCFPISNVTRKNLAYFILPVM
jgi:hypothetical protein